MHDVTWAGERTTGANGKVSAIGSTVDVARATYENSIGTAELSTVWVDTDIDLKECSFYYVPVLEVLVTRYSTYDVLAIGLDPAEVTGRPTGIQERALLS